MCLLISQHAFRLLRWSSQCDVLVQCKHEDGRLCCKAIIRSRWDTPLVSGDQRFFTLKLSLFEMRCRLRSRGSPTTLQLPRVLLKGRYVIAPLVLRALQVIACSDEEETRCRFSPRECAETITFLGSLQMNTYCTRSPAITSSELKRDGANQASADLHTGLRWGARARGGVHALGIVRRWKAEHRGSERLLFWHGSS